LGIVDEYSEVMIGMTCAVYGSYIIPHAALDAMEGERLGDILPQLVSFGEDDIVTAARKADHAAVDVSCGRDLLKFVKDISIYLPEGIAKISSYLYGMWFSYLSRSIQSESNAADKDDPVNYGKEEFARFVMDRIAEMASGLSPEDRLAVRTLSSFVLYKQEMHIAEERRAHGLWALMDLLYRKTSETEHLARVLHIALIREEIWKKNLFAG
jgi:hypothetical protein